MKNKPTSTRKDFSQVALGVVMRATGEEPPAEGETTQFAEVVPHYDGKNPHAVALGRLGGKVGGKARADSMTAERRSEIAKNAAKARWAKKDGQ